MKKYHEDGKLTFDEAARLVEEYIRDYSEVRTRVTSKHVAESFDVEKSHHNLVRINYALDERLEVTRESGSKATQYRIP